MTEGLMLRSCITGALLAFVSTADPGVALAAKPTKGAITLMQLSDVHGHMVPHQEIFPSDRHQAHSGGLAKLATLIKQVRADNPGSLLLGVGDTTHGSAETMFTLGDAIMPALNALNIDAFTPGNWDFGYGPQVFRNTFTSATILPLSPNNRTTLSATKSGCATGAPTCNVTKANFPSVAINLYNYDEATRTMGNRILPSYLIKQVSGVNVGVIGITSDVVPQQAQAFNTGFRFTMGYSELPQAIADAKAAGAQLIVVLSELGLAKNIQLVKEFPGIDVMFSGHTHERTVDPIIIEHGGGNISIVTEAGEDSFLGRLDVTVSQGKITSYNWKLMEADDSVPEDPGMKAIVDESRKTFVQGLDLRCHTFGPAGFPYGKGHTLCDPVDMVVGKTMVTLERWNVLEDVANNAVVDAFLELGQQIAPELDDSNSLSTTNGFRFDMVVLGAGTPIDGSNEIATGDITIGDLYNYYPIAAAMTVAEFTGGRLIDAWENVLNHVLDPNPYRQRGGWFLGFPHNMHFDIDLKDAPLTITQGRIRHVTINGQDLDKSKVYSMISCYGHGDPIDLVCRTSGARNVRFIVGEKNANGTIRTDGPYTLANPLTTEKIWDPTRTPIFRQAAPDNFAHPVDMLRTYLANHIITEADHGLGRVTAVSGVPVSDYDPTLVQPVQGAGPSWLKREVINED